MKKIWPLLIVLAVGLVIGLLIPDGGGSPAHDHGIVSAPAVKAETWTCSMHPQIRQPKPGQCPICAMDLIPVATEAEAVGPRELKLSAAAIKLAEIRTQPVERRYVSAEILMVGKVAYDETRVKAIASRVPGRLDRLFVDYTGMRVRKGDHLVSLYSPDLIAAQQELLQALSFNSRTANSVREKLRLWGLSREQIRQIERSKKVQEHLTINSPISGIVIHKDAVEGIYVNTGTPIYSIADLSRVWVKLDAYESDLAWLRYGQTVTFESEAYPGEAFAGKIAYIDPLLDAKTRTVKVRVNVQNPQQKLKPDMFVRARVYSKLTASGKVMEPDLLGKWISPMHPEIVKDGPGTCDICGMALVKAEELGYLAFGEVEKEAPLVIPASAPLLTGKRAVVYTAVPEKEGTFTGKEVTLGPRAGDYYIVKQGLAEGEQVVVNGAFKIDSDLQIQAKPSMMSPAGGIPTPGHVHHGAAAPAKEEAVPDAFREAIDAAADTYFAVQHALSSDSLDDAQKAARDLQKKVALVDMSLLKGDAHMAWMELAKKIDTGARGLASAKDIEAARLQLEALTEPVADAIKRFGSRKTTVFRFHCPMAFDNKGAFWLQNHEDTRNPYFGAAMLLCKDSVEPLIEQKKDKK